MTSFTFMFSDGVVSYPPEVISVTDFLVAHKGAYTTTRTSNNGTRLLFWERHLQRISQSTRILLASKPQFLFNFSESTCKFPIPSQSITPSVMDSAIRSLVSNSVSESLPIALRKMDVSEAMELAVTAVVIGKIERLRELDVGSRDSVSRIVDVGVHVGSYLPTVFGGCGNGARLAVVGCRRDVAEAKYSDWVRLRRRFERFRPPAVTELMLSNNGDGVLEGSVTNFFVVCRREGLHNNDPCTYEVQTAPVSDGVLPGIIRQLVIEVCLDKKIPLREVTPSWSENVIWEEAFITSSLRIMQHVEKIQVPSSWESLGSKPLEEISWEEKYFRASPGMVTSIIQKGIMEKACMEGYRL